MIGSTINFMVGDGSETMNTGIIKDKILITSDKSMVLSSEPCTHYLTVDTDGHIHFVFPVNIIDLNP